jgi:hypothetical protein
LQTAVTLREPSPTKKGKSLLCRLPDRQRRNYSKRGVTRGAIDESAEGAAGTQPSLAAQLLSPCLIGGLPGAG